MKRTIITTLAVGMLAGSAHADAVIPSAVAFEDGAVTASLTGSAGSAENGRKVFLNRKLGNCLACHTNADANDQPWHGEVGPPLDGVADRWSEAEIRGIVTNAKMMFEDSMSNQSPLCVKNLSAIWAWPSR